jgi:osmotically inducible protein OsmC
MPLQERTAKIVWQGSLRDGSGMISVGSGAVPEQKVTFSARTEDANDMTSPEELLAGAHAICYAMVLSNMLSSDGKEVKKLEVSARCTLDRIDGALKITHMALDVVGDVPGVDQAALQQVAEEGEKKCPVSNAIRGNVEVSVSAKVA